MAAGFPAKLGSSGSLQRRILSNWETTPSIMAKATSWNWSKQITSQTKAAFDTLFSHCTISLQAEKRFETAGRKFVEETIKLSTNLRPLAKWGYYAFPYCFNKGLTVDCPRDVKKENDR